MFKKSVKNDTSNFARMLAFPLGIAITHPIKSAAHALIAYVKKFCTCVYLLIRRSYIPRCKPAKKLFVESRLGTGSYTASNFRRTKLFGGRVIAKRLQRNTSLLLCRITAKKPRDFVSSNRRHKHSPQDAWDVSRLGPFHPPFWTSFSMRITFPLIRVDKSKIDQYIELLLESTIKITNKMGIM